MNALFINIDSLNRHFLNAYGGKVEFEVRTPNLDRFAERSAVFETHYAGSLPCMPARREFFAGVQEFLWRPWGPMEPFDTPLALAARQAGIITQLVTDHYHYFQYGSHGYFEPFQGLEFVRGHEFDAWKTYPKEIDETLRRQLQSGRPYGTHFGNRAAFARNIAGFGAEEDYFPARVFCYAADWLEQNHTWEQWLLVVDSFDVHEPFYCPELYISLYSDEDPHDPELIIWPTYGPLDGGESRLSDRQLAFVRALYAAKLTMVDRWLGVLLDRLDTLDLWKSTTVIITTDHGHYLGEHGWIGKPTAPLYNTLAATPLFIWQPASPTMGKRVGALTSAVDLYATIFNALGLQPPGEAHSRSLMPLLEGRTEKHRDWALYGYWASTANVTDGRYTYLHPCRTDLPAYCYSTMMMNPERWTDPPEAQPFAEAGKFLPYTGAPVWRYPARSYTRHDKPLLFDLRADPDQQEDLVGNRLPEEARMRAMLVEALRSLRAPEEQYARLDLQP